MKKHEKIKGSRLFKGYLTLLFLLLTAFAGFSQGVAFNTTLEAANSSAGLDINFSTQGFLISRVALTGTSSFAPLAAHVAGMMVFNTATIGDVTPGLYYNDGTKWVATTPSS